MRRLFLVLALAAVPASALAEPPQTCTYTSNGGACNVMVYYPNPSDTYHYLWVDCIDGYESESWQHGQMSSYTSCPGWW